MDIDALTSQAKAKFDHEAARRVLREKYQAKMLFGHRGGMFRCTPEMISFLSLFQDQDIVVEDLHGIPIQVNARELVGIMRARLQEYMTAWLMEYQDLSQNR